MELEVNVELELDSTAEVKAALRKEVGELCLVD
jgi:hypothetical protein